MSATTDLKCAINHLRERLEESDVRNHPRAQALEWFLRRLAHEVEAVSPEMVRAALDYVSWADSGGPEKAPGFERRRISASEAADAAFYAEGGYDGPRYRAARLGR